jgi:GTP-binding protein
LGNQQHVDHLAAENALPEISDARRASQDVSFSDEALEEARRIFSGPVAFLKSAPDSNVGKSSLLNALTNRNGLARTSNTPGRTQELNFFDVAEPLQFRLVDMPGYGFAEAPKDVVKKWRFLVNDYLRGRQVLKRAMVLIDSRHGAKPVDLEIMDMLDAAAVSYRLILTKADKIKSSALAEMVQQTEALARTRSAAFPEVIATSSEKGMGIADLRAAVIEAIRS